ncbi:ribosomal protein S18-alanine N-acetyltransferase [Brevibacterium samyangense]|uniref:Ribosomal protein S18-alanine N-acetyltransferase n=1 Tax=Brevibacterium samyangense TaxID=366888 RepID=A0ABP5EL42_9MICO
MTTLSPNPTVRLRRMRWWDLAEVARLDAEIFGADAWTTEYFWAEMAAPGRVFLVAEEDTAPENGSALLGFAGLSVSGTQSDVLTIASHPRVRGRGVGRALLDALLARAREDGCEVVHLDVRSDNAPALGLYASRGFEELDRRPGYYAADPATGVSPDAVLMRAFL